MPVILAASMRLARTRAGRMDDPVVLIVIVVALIVGLCLYLLFRRGSIADRARRELEGGPDDPSPEDLRRGDPPAPRTPPGDDPA